MGNVHLTDSERGKVGTISLKLFRRMQKKGMLERTARGHYFPTAKGWNEIRGTHE